jgi:hypothetical protein
MTFEKDASLLPDRATYGNSPIIRILINNKDLKTPNGLLRRSITESALCAFRGWDKE